MLFPSEGRKNGKSERKAERKGARGKKRETGETRLDTDQRRDPVLNMSKCAVCVRMKDGRFTVEDESIKKFPFTRQ